MKELKYVLLYYFESIPQAVKVRILRVLLEIAIHYLSGLLRREEYEIRDSAVASLPPHHDGEMNHDARALSPTEDVTDFFTQRRHYSVIPNKDALHPTRTYGYTIKLSPPIVDRQDHMDVEGIGYWPITPPRIRVLRYQGWYKYRCLAQRRCDELNHGKSSPHISTPVVDPNAD